MEDYFGPTQHLNFPLKYRSGINEGASLVWPLVLSQVKSDASSRPVTISHAHRWQILKFIVVAMPFVDGLLRQLPVLPQVESDFAGPGNREIGIIAPVA